MRVSMVHRFFYLALTRGEIPPRAARGRVPGTFALHIREELPSTPRLPAEARDRKRRHGIFVQQKPRMC